MTQTLVRERELATGADDWDVVGEVFEPTADTAEADASEGGWVAVADDQDYELEDAQEQVATVLDVLLDAWEAATAHQSSIRRATEHSFYRMILRAGDRAVPYLLDRLEREANPLWIWALGDISGEDPAAGTTSVDDAADAWLRWGAEQPSNR
jgi:hypothetical protein